MNSSHTQVYGARIERVISYIERHLGDDLSLDVLCDVACFSKFHFHRQFSAYAGLTVSQFVRQKRLHRAAHQLLYRPVMAVGDIALDAGFESPEAFARSFKNIYGQSPSIFRKQSTAVPPLAAAAWASTENMKDKLVTVELVEFPAVKIAVMDHLGPPEHVMQTAARFIDWRKANGLPPSVSRTFNILYDDPSEVAPSDYRMGLAAEAVHTPKIRLEDVTMSQIPAGHCAKLRHRGSRDGLGASVSQLYHHWLPASWRDVRDYPLFLERVNLYPETPQPDLITDIYLPLR